MFYSKTSSQFFGALKRNAEQFVQKYFYPLLPYPKTQYVIIANERTGSNLLVSLLSSHPHIHQYGEIVGESILRQEGNRAKIRTVGPSRYIRNGFKKRFYKHAVGMKILYHQLKDGYAEKWDIAGSRGIFEEICNHNNIKVVHLKRRNHLKILVSAELARQTKEYVKRNLSSKTHEIPITLSPEKCTSFFQGIIKDENYFQRCFESHEILEIYYEDLVSDTSIICEKVLDFLGANRCDLKSSTLKQSQKTLSERIQNYEEIKKFFKGTPSEIFFED